MTLTAGLGVVWVFVRFNTSGRQWHGKSRTSQFSLLNVLEFQFFVIPFDGEVESVSEH